MEFRRPLLCCCVLLSALLAGCRQNHAARELLERELRLQEDRIYALESELDDAHRALAAMQCRMPSVDRGSTTPGAPNEPPRTFAPSTAPSVEIPKSIGPPPHVDLGPPSVDLPPPGAAMPSTSPGTAPS